MAAIPIRLPPLPGEALDSWLETYAHLLHATIRDIFAFAGVDWARLTSEAERPHKLWLYHLDEPDLIALSAVTGVPAATLADMTLAVGVRVDVQSRVRVIVQRLLGVSAGAAV